MPELNEPQLRLGVFIGLFASILAMVAAEALPLPAEVLW